MAPLDPRKARVAFLRSFKQLAPYKHRYEVWRDFVTMAACSLHNGFFKDQAREEEYLQIIAAYEPEDQQIFPLLLTCLINTLQAEPRDVLGPIYMELEIANKDAGQFFTPPELSELMARINCDEQLSILDDQPICSQII